jgi:hypothetical protein
MGMGMRNIGKCSGSVRVVEMGKEWCLVQDFEG